MLNNGVLGMNARNINYIKKFNPKKQIKLANNKIKTKKFLWERGIPVPRTYGVIHSRKQLLNYNLGDIPHDNFVIKPNKGSKGKGIYIVKRIKKEEKRKNHEHKEKKKKSWWKFFTKEQKKENLPYIYKTTGKTYTDQDFKRILMDTLDGKNSTSVSKDKILIEEKLLPSKKFSQYCQEGLADIRIILFNLVPVTAMIRIPTKKSEGKANIAKGGTALGIDITSGKVKYNRKRLKTHFPNNYKNFKNLTIEYWDEILLLSSKIQFFVNLGYLALDWVITSEGPKLLEINGRAGLEIQKITGVKMENAFKKISGLKINNPEKGIEISKALFSSKKTQIGKNKILYLSQMGKIKTAEKENIDIIVKLNLNSKNNYISKQLYEEITRGTNTTKGTSKTITQNELILEENNIRIKNLKFLVDEELKQNELSLGTKISLEYFIKPIHKTKTTKNIIKTEKVLPEEKNQLLEIDKGVHSIGKKLILSSVLKPTNYLDELDIFITKQGKYNPQFNYKRPDIERIEEYKKQLLYYKDKLNTLNSEFKKIFEQKIEELLYRGNLIEAYSKQDFKKILFYNKKLFGDFSNELITYAKSKSFEAESPQEKLGDYMSTGQIRKEIEEIIYKKGFNNVDIIVSSTNLSRISVVKGQTPRIKILEGAKIRTLELKSILAHEIDTHLTRYVNGQQTERKIFQDGTGFYLKDEEGLAVYNAFQETNKIKYYKNTIYKNYFLTNEAQKYSFEKIFELVKFLYNGQNMETLFRKTMRLKRGIENTGIVNEGAIFLKDKVYLDGYEYIKKHFNTEGNQKTNKENLYQGKYKLSELQYIK